MASDPKVESPSLPPLPLILDRQEVARSRLFSVEALYLRFSNGAERHYERLRGSGREAVMILALDGEQLLLLHEYAAGTHAYEWGLPKGLIDAGESGEQAALRELREEAGFGARQLTHLRTLTTAPTYMGSRIQLWLAEDLYPAPLEGDEPEPLVVSRWPLAQLDQLLAQPQLQESRVLAAIYLLRDLLRSRP